MDNRSATIDCLISPVKLFVRWLERSWAAGFVISSIRRYRSEASVRGDVVGHCVWQGYEGGAAGTRSLHSRTVFWLATIWLVFSAVLASAEDGEDQMLRMMCSRGVWRAALEYVDAQVSELEYAADSDAIQADRLARWTMRKMECMALAALQGEASLWDAIQPVYDQFLARHPRNRRLPWVKWQLMRCKLLRLQAEFAQYLATPARTELRDSALELIRQVEQDAVEIADEIRQRQPIAARLPSDSPEQAPVEQLNQLQADTDLVRCEAMLVRMQLYPAGSPDRISAATTVEQLATSALQRVDPSSSSWLSLDVARKIAQLELGNAEDALAQLVELAHLYLDQPAGRRAAQVAVEYLLKHGELSQAAGIVAVMRSGGASPESVLAELQLRVAELAHASDDAPSQQSLEGVLALAKQIGDRFGSYWRNRADAMLLATLDLKSESPALLSLDLIKAEVRQLLGAGDDEAAIQRLMSGAEQLVASDRMDEAIELAALAAALLERQEKWVDVVDRVEPFVLGANAGEAAARLHLRLIVALAQALRDRPADEKLRKRYQDLLERQLTRWPDAEATDQAQRWLRDWLLRHAKRERYGELVLHRALVCRSGDLRERLLMGWAANTLSLPPDALAAALDSAQELLVSQDVPANAASVVKGVWLAVDAIGRWVDPITSRRRRGQLVQRLVAAPSSRIAQLLQAATLIEVARHESLADTLRQAQEYKPAELPPDLLHALLGYWVEAIDQRPPPERSQWAEAVQLSISLEDEQAATRQPLDQAWHWRATAWLKAERLQEATEHLRKLAIQYPRDGMLQLQLAGIVVEQSPPDWNEALRIINRLIAGAKPGTRLDFAARWQRVALLRWSGNLEQAAGYAKLVLASFPQIPDRWRYRFEQVAAQVP